jgi:hypothetical protein
MRPAQVPPNGAGQVGLCQGGGRRHRARVVCRAAAQYPPGGRQVTDHHGGIVQDQRVELTLKLSTASMPRARPSWRSLRTTRGFSSKGELNGQVVHKLKTARRDGTTHVVMSPLELMQRPAALVPRPRLHLIRLVAGRCEQPDAAQRRPFKPPGASGRWSRGPCSGRHGQGVAGFATAAGGAGQTLKISRRRLQSWHCAMTAGVAENRDTTSGRAPR